MEKIISKFFIYMVILSVAIACKPHKNEDPSPSAVEKEKDLSKPYGYSSNLNRYVTSTGSHYYQLGSYDDDSYNTANIGPYNFETVLCRAFMTPEHAIASGINNTVRLYGYKNQYNGDWFYTIDLNELGMGNVKYQYYGSMASVFADNYHTGPGTLVPVYRYYNSQKGYHFYTSNASELAVKNLGYTYEGIGFYGIKF